MSDYFNDHDFELQDRPDSQTYRVSVYYYVEATSPEEADMLVRDGEVEPEDEYTILLTEDIED